jgi:hypothetical protein
MRVCYILEIFNHPPSYEDAVSMVTTSEGKHFSLGLELELLAATVNL